jgi:hypothetical protein
MAISPALQALFDDIVSGANKTWCDFDLYTITLAGGDVLRFTTADFDINSGGNLYASTGIRVDQDPHKGSKTQAHWKVGLDTDTWIVIFMPRPIDPVTGAAFPDQIGSVPWIQASSAGALDSADFQVDRAYFSAMPTWPMPPGGQAPLGTKTIFAGIVAEVDTTDLTVTITVNDYRSLFAISMPLHFYQAQCRHMLYDVGCGLNKASFAVNGTVGAGSTQATIVVPGMAIPSGSGTYTLGFIEMMSGLNSGFLATVKNWNAPNLELNAPLPFAVEAGDTFTAFPGCDWSMGAQGCGGFNNLANFGGTPYVPPPETVT